MKKTLFIVLTCLLLVSCTQTTDGSNQEKQMIIEEIEKLQTEKESIEKLVVEEKIKKDTAIYVLKLKVGMKRLPLDFNNKIKDAFNDFTFEIPVSKQYYDELNVGDKLEEKTRIGSLILKGSYGKQYIEVVEKSIH